MLRRFRRRCLLDRLIGCYHPCDHLNDIYRVDNLKLIFPTGFSG